MYLSPYVVFFVSLFSLIWCRSVCFILISTREMSWYYKLSGYFKFVFTKLVFIFFFLHLKDVVSFEAMSYLIWVCLFLCKINVDWFVTAVLVSIITFCLSLFYISFYYFFLYFCRRNFIYFWIFKCTLNRWWVGWVTHLIMIQFFVLLCHPLFPLIARVCGLKFKEFICNVIWCCEHYYNNKNFINKKMLLSIETLFKTTVVVCVCLFFSDFRQSILAFIYLVCIVVYRLNLLNFFPFSVIIFTRKRIKFILPARWFTLFGVI